MFDLMGWKSQILWKARGSRTVFVTRATLFLALVVAVGVGNIEPAQQVESSAAAQAKQLYAEASAALRAGDLTKARKAFEDELKLNPQDARGHDLLG